jgi:putative FmdB family regulatory protein
MPTYEYHCEKCKKDFELFQSMKDNALTTCPKEQCRQKSWGRGKVRRLLGAGAGLIFKGSGFYTTDYRSEGYKAAAKSDASESAPQKAAESKPADSKADSTPKPAATPASNAPNASNAPAAPRKSKQKE